MSSFIPLVMLRMFSDFYSGQRKKAMKLCENHHSICFKGEGSLTEKQLIRVVIIFSQIMKKEIKIHGLILCTPKSTNQAPGFLFNIL
jgi:predicted restriction endonuclease